MKFIPFGPRALVRPIAEQVSNKSGIMMPDTAKEKPVEGEILALGQTIAAVEMGERSGYSQHMPRLGDRVLFGKYAGSPIKIDGEDLLIMHVDELLGRVELTEADEKKLHAEAVHRDIEAIKARGGTPKHPWPPKKEKASRGK